MPFLTSIQFGKADLTPPQFNYYRNRCRLTRLFRPDFKQIYREMGISAKINGRDFSKNRGIPQRFKLQAQRSLVRSTV